MPQAGADPEAPNAPGGQDLFDYVDLHPDGLPISSIRRIFAQIADALYFLHEHGIVHRDIKDENVVLDHLGNVQVIDFGSAAYVKEGKKFDTFSGTLECVLFCFFFGWERRADGGAVSRRRRSCEERGTAGRRRTFGRSEYWAT